MKKKRPNLKIIEGGKLDSEPPTAPEHPPALDYLAALSLSLTASSTMFPSDLFVFAPMEANSAPGAKRPIDAQTWGELASLVDRWRAAQDEFTLASLNEELKRWLDRR